MMLCVITVIHVMNLLATFSGSVTKSKHSVKNKTGWLIDCSQSEELVHIRVLFLIKVKPEKLSAQHSFMLCCRFGSPSFVSSIFTFVSRSRSLSLSLFLLSLLL